MAVSYMGEPLPGVQAEAPHGASSLGELNPDTTRPVTSTTAPNELAGAEKRPVETWLGSVRALMSHHLAMGPQTARSSLAAGLISAHMPLGHGCWARFPTGSQSRSTITRRLRGAGPAPRGGGAACR